jgi:hypothetical protein
MVCAGFPRRRAGASAPSSPDGRLPTFTSMTELAASLTVVGRKAQLVGVDTGAVILTATRETAGANGLKPSDEWNLWLANGEEFDGLFAPLPLSVAGAPTWGVAGDRATGGVSPASGSLQFPGFRKQNGRRREMKSTWYVDSIPGSPASGDCICAGWARTNAGVIYAAGFGYGAAQWRSGGCIGGVVDVLTWSSATGAATPVVFGEFNTILAMSQNSATAASSGHFSGAHHATQASTPSGWTNQATASASSLAADQTDFEPTIGRKGVVARCIILRPGYTD